MVLRSRPGRAGRDPGWPARMIYNLQVLRALAAYLVFLLHFSLYAGPVLPRPDLLTFGAAGVDTVSYTHLTLPTNREV